MDARELAIAFAQAFCASDLETLESLLAPALKFRGPLFSFDSRKEYLQSLATCPPEPGTCELIQALGKGQEAAILYEYGRRESRMTIAQFVRASQEHISEIRLVFDAAHMPGFSGQGANEQSAHR